MEYLLSSYKTIKEWGLRANEAELVAAVHVIQNFIVQHMSRDQRRSDPPVPYSQHPGLEFKRKGSTWMVSHKNEDWPLRLYARDVYYGTGRLLATLTLDRQDPGVPRPARILTSSVDLLTARQRTMFAEEAARRLTRAAGAEDQLKVQQQGITTLLDALLERLHDIRYEMDIVSLEDVELPTDLTPKYAVWPIVPKSRPGLLIAPSGSGKSTLAAGIAVGVVTGHEAVRGDDPAGEGQPPVLLL